MVLKIIRFEILKSVSKSDDGYNEMKTMMVMTRVNYFGDGCCK